MKPHPGHTLTIRLQPGKKNRIKLSQGNGNRPVYGLEVFKDEEITWTHQDQGSAPKIRRWLVSFVENEWSGDPLEPSKSGTPLEDADGNEVWRFSGGAGHDPVETRVAHTEGDFQFAVAVVDENGDLYALDPEIRVRPGARGTG